MPVKHAFGKTAPFTHEQPLVDQDGARPAADAGAVRQPLASAGTQELE